jgi:hypothetical protein
MGYWLERDPLEFVDALDLYLYVSNNPVRHHDWSGLKCEDVCTTKSWGTVTCSVDMECDCDHCHPNTSEDICELSGPLGKLTRILGLVKVEGKAKSFKNAHCWYTGGPYHVHGRQCSWVLHYKVVVTGGSTGIGGRIGRFIDSILATLGLLNIGDEGTLPMVCECKKCPDYPPPPPPEPK